MIDPIAMTSLAELSGNVGFGLVTIGAGLGIGLIGSKAAEATGRNPGASSPIMVIAITLAALIEGVALISICSLRGNELGAFCCQPDRFHSDGGDPAVSGVQAHPERSGKKTPAD